MSPTKKTTITVSRSLLLTLLFALFAFGVLIGRSGSLLGTAYEISTEEALSEKSGEFRFIRPSPEPRRSDNGRMVRELKPFRYKVDAFIKRKIKSGDASEVSVYFRDLRGGHRFGIRENETFSSENLLKLPLMIAYLKWAETNSFALRKTITAVPAPDGQGGLVSPTPLTTLETGRAYTVDDLIIRMIAHNDDDAHALLLVNLPPEYLDRIFKDIYVNYDPAKKGDAVPFSANAPFYRVLYDASYLSREMSEKALHYLSLSTFKNGVIAGIPQNVDCAVKFGERTMPIDHNGAQGDREMKQLQEFGIIYHKERPYLMGVMARGEDGEKLTNVIRDITTLMYDEVDNQSR